MTELAVPPSAMAAYTTALRVCSVLTWLRLQELQLAEERDEALLALVGAGLSYQAISELSGLTRGRISQIVQSARTTSDGSVVKQRGP
jgi:DNA-directed RNA polymerase specialized sigma24 family protein